MTTVAAQKSTNLVRLDVNSLSSRDMERLPGALCEFLDIVGTATARGTFYNSKEELQKAVLSSHKNLFEIDRGIYGIALLLGSTDYSIQVGLGHLLDNPRVGDDGFLTAEQESKLIVHLLKEIHNHRMFNLFTEFRKERVNNARTRKLILRTILGADVGEILAWWCVKYRNKIRDSLEHAWGKRTTGILRAILGKRHGQGRRRALSQKENSILYKNIGKYNKYSTVMECVAFILGHERHMTVPLLDAYSKAKEDLSLGEKLPLEVLFGIRNHFHQGEYSKEDVYKLVKKSGSLTNKQKMLVQKSSKKAGVKIDFNPMSQDAVSLYVYAFEMGLTNKIQSAMDSKAEKAAGKLPVKYDKIGVVVDTSESTRGDSKQALRPIAISLATRDMLVASAHESTVVYAGGQDGSRRLARPRGDTAIAEALVETLQAEPDAVYILTDGYENSPAGRTDEVVNIVRKMGNNTPIFQVTPVMAAEAKGVKQLSKQIPAMPVNKPETIGLSMIKGLIDQDVARGLLGLARTALPIIGLKLENSDDFVE